MLSSFQAKTCVGTSYDYGLPREICGGQWWCLKNLAVEHLEEIANKSHIGKEEQLRARLIPTR